MVHCRHGFESLKLQTFFQWNSTGIPVNSVHEHSVGQAERLPIVGRPTVGSDCTEFRNSLLLV